MRTTSCARYSAVCDERTPGRVGDVAIVCASIDGIRTLPLIFVVDKTPRIGEDKCMGEKLAGVQGWTRAPVRRMPALVDTWNPRDRRRLGSPELSVPEDSPITDEDQGAAASSDHFLAGRYRLCRFISEGGMSSVYLARDTRLERDVAAKVVGEMAQLSPENRKRFEREGIALAALSSPHLPAIHDMGIDDGVGFIIMQFIEAPTLGRLLASEGRFPLRRVGKLLCQLLDALQHMHESGFVHRDVKPSNILIDDSDHLTVVDLGVALQLSASPLTGRGYAVGTPKFMSPEQRLGHRVTRACDIYAVGLIAALMLFGTLPYNAWRYMPETIDFAQCGLPAPWVDIITGCLAENPSDRHRDCSIVRELLVKAMADL